MQFSQRDPAAWCNYVNPRGSVKTRFQFNRRVGQPDTKLKYYEDIAIVCETITLLCGILTK